MKRKPRYKRKPWKPIDYDKFRETRLLARLTQQEVACLLRVTDRTVRLWENGEVAIPYASYKLLRILTGYELPGEAWAGWSIRDGKLWSPERRSFDAASLSYMWLTFVMARRWQESIREALQAGEGTPPAGSGSGFMPASEDPPLPPSVVLRVVK